MHVDMDSFFASVEIREHPELKGLPVIVGADPEGGHGRGVVSTCSYEARKFGVHSGMPISKAYRLCPHGVYLPVNMSLYRRVSEKIMNLLRTYADKFEKISIDEAYMDISSCGSYEKAYELGKKIKELIYYHEKLTCSCGIGPNKFIAKLATTLSKPNGLKVIKPNEIFEILENLDVTYIPGVGKSTKLILNEMGIKTIGELRSIPLDILVDRLGKFGLYIYEHAQGKGSTIIAESREPKSISREITFRYDTSDANLLKKTLRELANEVHSITEHNRILYHCVSIKIRFANFETHTRQKTLRQPVNSAQELYKIVETLFDNFIKGYALLRAKVLPVRLVGVRVSDFILLNA